MTGIPKKLHYTWFSKDPFPAAVHKCIQSWKEYLPDYDIICWDYDRVLNIENVFLQEALHEKKWAFASDFVRLYAVYNEGGVYLDTDVMLFANFTNYMNDSCFIGRENSFHKLTSHYCVYLTSHCFGAVRYNLFIKECLDYYQDRHFILTANENLSDELKYDQKTLPYIQALIAQKYGYDWRYKFNLKTIHSIIKIYPSYHFDAVKRYPDTVCKHLALGSWRDDKKTMEKVTLWYKLEWRLIKMLDNFLKSFSYMIVKF